MAIGIAENQTIRLGFPFDPRGVAEVERTRDLTNRKPRAFSAVKEHVKKLGRDKDGAWRAFRRIDGKA